MEGVRFFSSSGIYRGIPENSLNREREAVNLNEEKLKPRGENEIQRFMEKRGKKSTYESGSPPVKIQQAFLCCYQGSGSSLAGQLSGLGWGGFLLILAHIFWLQWAVSPATETSPFTFHKADLVRSPPSVRPGGRWPSELREGLGRPPPGSQKPTTKDTLKSPHVSQASRSTKPSRLRESRLIFTILTDISSGETDDSCVIIKNNS